MNHSLPPSLPPSPTILFIYRRRTQQGELHGVGGRPTHVARQEDVDVLPPSLPPSLPTYRGGTQ